MRAPQELVDDLSAFKHRIPRRNMYFRTLIEDAIEHIARQHHKVNSLTSELNKKEWNTIHNPTKDGEYEVTERYQYTPNSPVKYRTAFCYYSTSKGWLHHLPVVAWREKTEPYIPKE